MTILRNAETRLILAALHWVDLKGTRGPDWMAYFNESRKREAELLEAAAELRRLRKQRGLE